MQTHALMNESSDIKLVCG